ncbi:CHAP domain-containing protein [Amycolatopsis cynarae]|uniref:CHAP domain-containing protein n=1 Tax=Amycolatopsis cynarae TaxID=2995223 RepID=A0ABY7AXR1_9PSEU|nr:CHAP domain-containing protein [Amycolatopsis sp. HUAS 11-8]WAL64490.1 CHAP domain-containing protein [Amycolatopsis sp. HUAS 11-8]
MSTTVKRLLSRTVKPAAVAALAVAALAVAPATSEAAVTAAPENVSSDVSILAAGDGTPAGAVKWYSNHNGSTAYQGYCEKAAENAYGTTGVWASANAHWNGASPKHAGNYSPPLGAFVYWNISAYGHVGISDGAGGFWATSVNGHIGHVTKAMGGYNYFSNYRGWTPAAVPHQ